MKENPELIPSDNGMGFLSDDGGLTYNRCHCEPTFPLPLNRAKNSYHDYSTRPLLVWSNFEIGDLDFWRGEAYGKFFEHLDRAGGFYYERWGDAPVHSIGAALLAPKDKLHFFHDIGYRHEPFQRCPQSDDHKRGKCWCDASENFGTSLYFSIFCLQRGMLNDAFQTTIGTRVFPSSTDCLRRHGLGAARGVDKTDRHPLCDISISMYVRRLFNYCRS